MPPLMPHSKRPRENDGETNDKENIGAGPDWTSSTKKPVTVPRPFRAARGVAASHRQDAPRNNMPTSLQHTPASSTRTSGTQTEKPVPNAAAAAATRRRPPYLSTRAGAPKTQQDVTQEATTRNEETVTPVLSELEQTWRVKRSTLEATVAEMEAKQSELESAKSAVHDVIESMLCTHESNLEEVQNAIVADAEAHEDALKALEDREMRCRALKSRSLDEVEALKQRTVVLKETKEKVQEQTVLEHETIEATRQALAKAEEDVSAAKAALDARQIQEERMKDASYGLSGEVKEMVLEMETLRRARHEHSVAAMKLEVQRRELFSRCESLKGSIRVYCRVKGNALPLPTATTTQSTTDSARSTMSDALRSRQGSTDGLERGDNDAAEEEREEAGVADGVDSLANPPPSATDSMVDDTAREESLASSVATTLTDGGGRSRRAVRIGAAPSAKHNRLAAAAGGSEAAENLRRARRDVTADNDDDAEALYTFDGTAEDFGANPAAEDEQATAAMAVTEQDEEGDVNSPTTNTGVGVSQTAVVEPPPASLHRTLHVHSARANATSTGRHTSSEAFTFDRVFDGHASQADVYREMEPLVHSAVDGYAVCVFAYGQTGSGKTYTMEGNVQQPERFGVIPRALQTVFKRQEVLAKEGWRYELSCYFVEIYNDTIRDLLQNPSVYEAGGAAGTSNAHYHAVKHSDDRTSITNVRECTIQSMEEFRKIHRQATQNRRTARTKLNERSSRSHSIFTLHITGTNKTIGQKSEGVLCLVDLAGSERVNESGAQGQQFKEAISINRSLLDLGKCISAMRSGGSAVAPWRNSKLTYLLQHYLGAKGGKMLMLVNVSNERRHLPESLNALRFAVRVSETVVGTSVKRVTNL